MSERRKVADSGRRKFLKGVAVAGGAAAVTAGARAAVETETAAAPAQSQASGSRGYRVTPHIAKYYEKARF